MHLDQLRAADLAPSGGLLGQTRSSPKKPETMSEEPFMDSPMPRESTRAFARFVHYLQQGPDRQLQLTAKHFGVATSTVSEQARRFGWHRRAAAWDDRQRLQACPAPERLQVAASAAPIAPVVTDEVRSAEREFLVAVETFRAVVEALGRDQLQTARAMTAVSRRSVGKFLEEGRILSARDLPAFVNCTVNLAAAAQASWGKSLGVDALLDRLKSSLAAVDVAVAEPMRGSDEYPHG